MIDWSTWGYLAEPRMTNYLFHLLAWMLPILLIQWLVAWKILWRNRTLVFWPAIAFGTYYTVVDFVAVDSGVWYFDPAQNLGILFFGVLPLEEILFFYITALLVSQSFVMFLPDHLRK